MHHHLVDMPREAWLSRGFYPLGFCDSPAPALAVALLDPATDRLAEGEGSSLLFLWAAATLR
jgi:hypothetical protein